MQSTATNTTHSSIRPGNLQRKNEVALMSCRKREVEHIVSAGGLTSAHPSMKNRIFLNYKIIKNAHKVRKKTLDFVVFL